MRKALKPLYPCVCLVLAGLALSGCGVGDIDAGTETTLDEAADEIRIRNCSVSPSPALVGQDYTVEVFGLRRNTRVVLRLTDASGVREHSLSTDGSGRLALSTQSSAAGPVGAVVEGPARKGGTVQLASCAFEVIEPPVCGNARCDVGESCDACASDCGACAPPPPACGDGTCNDTESCSTCSADCGACPGPTCEPAATSLPVGFHNAGRDCLGCHTGGGAPAFSIAGTLYSGASSTTPVSGATLVFKDASGRTFKLITAGNGNFYTGDTNIRFPVTTYATKCPNVAPMAASVSDGSCNSCHGTGSRIHLP